MDTLPIKFAMIDAASLVRTGSRTPSFEGEVMVRKGMEILKGLAPLVEGWLPDNVTLDESGNIVVNSNF